MFGKICLAAWGLLFYHGFSLVGYIFLGKSMLRAKIFWLYALTNPSSTRKSIAIAAQAVTRHVLWVIGLMIVLIMLYH